MVTSGARRNNPFMPGNGIEPKYLAGREELAEAFSRSLGSFEHGLPHNLVVFGLRGTGKTVLLKRFKNISEANRWIGIEREFNARFCNEEAFAEALAKDLLSMASEASVQKKIAEAGKTIAEFLKPKEITVFGVSYKPFYKERKGLLEDYLKQLLVSNWPVFQKAGVKGVVFLYDEFHTIKDKPEKNTLPLASILGAMSYAQRNGCKYYLVLSGLPFIKTRLKEAKTYTERMFSFKEVDNLTPKQAKEAITQTLKGSGYAFEKELADKIIEETKGYPYFIQFYGYFLIENSNKTTLNLRDLNALRTPLIKELDVSFFEDRYNLAASKEKEILQAMASSTDKDVPALSIRKKAKTTHHSLMELLKRLQEKGLVYRASRGHYGFSIPLFKEYLRRQK
ncbi:ATP-binding protein [Candidatus Micrarchaeota archaeon]|nr:ATP-binding protein [Candidatus Micrarchaeota archaeon]